MKQQLITMLMMVVLNLKQKKNQIIQGYVGKLGIEGMSVDSEQKYWFKEISGIDNMEGDEIKQLNLKISNITSN